MTVESVTYISDLDDTYPAGSGPPHEGDNHIRNIKTGLSGSFPNFVGAAVTATEAELNYVDITTLGTSEASKAVTADASGNINFDGTGAVDLTDITNPINIGLTSNPATGAHLALGQNIAQSKADATTAAVFSINPLGGNVSIGAQSGTGSVTQYDATYKRLSTAAGGILNLHSDANTDSETRHLRFTHQDGTARGLIGHPGTGDLTVRNEIHSGNLTFQGENAAGTVTTLAYGNPDGVFASYYAGTARLLTGASGTVNLRSDGNTDTETRYLRFSHQDGTARGYVGHAGSDILYLVNEIHGGDVGIRAESSAGVLRTILQGSADSYVAFYESGVMVARSAAAASGGFQINNTLTGAGFERALTTGDFTNATHTTPTITAPTINTSVAGTAVLDEDDMASDSATQIATQQSIKAYVDTENAHRGALVYKSANQSIGNATLVTLTWDSEDYDTDSIHDTVTNNHRLTVPAGVTKVRVSVSLDWDPHATGYRRLDIIHSAGGRGLTSQRTLPVDGAATQSQSATSTVVSVTAADYFYVRVYQNSGGSLDINAVAAVWFSMEIIE